MTERRDNVDQPSGGRLPMWRRDTSQDHVVRPVDIHRDRASGAGTRGQGTYRDRLQARPPAAVDKGNSNWLLRGPRFSPGELQRILAPGPEPEQRPPDTRHGNDDLITRALELTNRMVRGEPLQDTTERRTASGAIDAHKKEADRSLSSLSRAHGAEQVVVAGDAQIRVREQEVAAVADRPAARPHEAAETFEFEFLNTPAVTVLNELGGKSVVYADQYLELLAQSQPLFDRAAELRLAGRAEEADALEAKAPISKALNKYRIIQQHPMLLGVKRLGGQHYSLRELGRIKSSDPDKYAELVEGQGMVVYGFGLVPVAAGVDAMDKVLKGKDHTEYEGELALAIASMQRGKLNRWISRFSNDTEEKLASHRAEFAAYAAEHGLQITDDGHILLEKAVFNIKGRLVSIFDYYSAEIGTDVRQFYNYRIGEWHDAKPEMTEEMVIDGVTTEVTTATTGMLYAAPHEFAEVFGKETRHPGNRILSRSPLGAVLGGKIVLLRVAMHIDQSAIEKKGMVLVHGKVRRFSKVKAPSLYVMGIVK